MGHWAIIKNCISVCCKIKMNKLNLSKITLFKFTFIIRTVPLQFCLHVFKKKIFSVYFQQSLLSKILNMIKKVKIIHNSWY